MPTAKTAPATAARVGSSSRRRVPDTDALCTTLDRVLKVSQPKTARTAISTSTAKAAAVTQEGARKRAPPAKPQATSSTAPAAKAARAAAAVEKPTARRVAPPASNPASKSTVRAPAPKAAAKPKPEPETQHDPLPWMTAGMSVRDRAMACQDASNETLRTLTEAQTAGWRSGAGGEWDSRIKDALRIGRAAANTLRELYATAETNRQRISVERGAFGLTQRCLFLELYDVAWDMLVSAKPHLVRLYHAEQFDPVSRSSDWTEVAHFPEPNQLPEEPIRVTINNFIMAVWCCAIAKRTFKLETLRKMLLPPHGEGRGNLHPFHLSLALPVNSTLSQGIILNRLLSAVIVDDQAEWLLVHLLHVFSLLIATATTGKNTPANLWITIGRKAQTHLETCSSDSASSRRVAEYLAFCVDLVEQVRLHRGETPQLWYTAQWSTVGEIWINVGRKLGDSDVLSSALAAMTTAVELSPAGVEQSTSSSSGRSTPATPTSSRASRPKVTGKLPNAATVVTKQTAIISKVYLELCANSVTASSVADAVSRIDLTTLLTGVCSLEESAISTISGALRAVERMRRHLVKEADVAVQKVVDTWLLEVFIFFEGALKDAVKHANITSACLPAVVDMASIFIKRPPVSGNLLELVDRARAIVDEHEAIVGATMQLYHTSCLAGNLNAAAATAARRQELANAASFAQRACEWSQEALDRHVSMRDDPSVKFMSARLARAYELYGYCLIDTDKLRSLRAFCYGLLSFEDETMRTLKDGIGKQSLGPLFGSELDFAKNLLRVVYLIDSDEESAKIAPQVLNDTLQARQLDPELRAAVMERILEAIASSTYHPHVQRCFLALGDQLLQLYDAENYPVRRLRTCLSRLTLIASTGVLADTFDTLQTEILALADRAVENPGNDQNLVKFCREYVACAQIIATTYAHNHPDSAHNVDISGRAALDAARMLAFPPPPPKSALRGRAKPHATKSSRTTTRKAPAATKTKAIAKADSVETPVAPVALPDLDDAPRLCQLLGALGSLFGIRGNVVQKIETLNILRALQHARPALVDGFADTAGLLATEYGRLGKITRASHVFEDSVKHATDGKAGAAALATLYLRQARFLALVGDAEAATLACSTAEGLSANIPNPNANTMGHKWLRVTATAERSALANMAVAAIKFAKEDVSSALENLLIAYRQLSRAVSGVANVAAPSLAAEEPAIDEDGPQPSASEEAKDAQENPKAGSRSSFPMAGKYLSGIQWYYAEALFDITFDIIEAFSRWGGVVDCQYYLDQATGMVPIIKSSTMDARVAFRAAELEVRRMKLEKTAKELDHATQVLAVNGPDAVDLRRIRGELLSRQKEAAEADEEFINAVDGLVGFDEEFKTLEAILPSPNAKMLLSKEPALPHTLGNILRQRAWLLREAGIVDEYESLLQQLDLVTEGGHDASDRLLLEARVAMHDAFSQFKTDLFMSSLTESTIAMTMATPDKRATERQSTRHGAIIMLDRASEKYRLALESMAHSGRVEDVRQACVSLAVLGAFQTSLGHGSPAITTYAANLLASVPAITLERQLLSAVDNKYPDPEADDYDWPKLESAPFKGKGTDPLEAHWQATRQKHSSSALLRAEYDMSKVPENWAVVSITVTDDRNTMLVTRHQNGHEPIVFCIPLDRQGRREGDDESELFTFDAGIAEMQAIIDANDENIASIKKVVDNNGRKVWWKTREAIDNRLGELLATIEFCWLGAFKTVLNPRLEFDPDALAAFRSRLDRIFSAALSSAGSKVTRVRLNDTLLACFATLGSKCRDEEIEDLVYFVLDVYQFHGIAVALAELDFDQIGVDVKAALADLEATHSPVEHDEHLLLALDKNVQGIPWESIPILRGRAVCRIPSLPFLLDQVALGELTHTGKRTFDAAKTTYYLNPSADLKHTQASFEARLTALEKDGWSGLIGSAPSEEQFAAALKDSELVMYYGHGGGEVYLRPNKIRNLPQCAVTMLWGCSSGMLKDQGEFDRTGTPNEYVLAGCPCLVANLWDVTDRDIDKLTAAVMDELGLEAGKLRSGGKGKGGSVAQAIARAREGGAIRMKYLTGAATVVYGVPVYVRT